MIRKTIGKKNIDLQQNLDFHCLNPSKGANEGHASDKTQEYVYAVERSVAFLMAGYREV